MVTERSATDAGIVTEVIAVLLLFDMLGSLTREDTLAVLLMDVTLKGAVIVTVMASAVPPDVRVGVVQVTTPELWPQVQPLPLALT